jgi:hypothetical protein
MIMQFDTKNASRRQISDGTFRDCSYFLSLASFINFALISQNLIAAYTIFDKAVIAKSVLQRKKSGGDIAHCVLDSFQPGHPQRVLSE